MLKFTYGRAAIVSLGRQRHSVDWLDGDKLHIGINT